MNTRQIKDLLQRDVITESQFCGIYAENTLPQMVKSYPCGVIVNTDPKDRPGQHWVAFYFPSSERGEFFDSFGHPPQVYSAHFVQFLNRNCEHWTFNPRTLQSVLTAVCGEYCIFYLMHRARGVGMNTIVHLFSVNYITNDQMVYEFVLKLMRQ